MNIVLHPLPHLFLLPESMLVVNNMRERKIRRKLHTCQGFTLAETLLAVLIMLLVSTIVATGIPAAKNAYEKVVLASNAQVLLSTTISTLQNELGTAKDVETPVNGEGEKEHSVITYYNVSRGAFSKLYVESEDSKIMFHRYFSKDGMGITQTDSQLISSKTATGDLYVTYSKVEITGSLVTFYGLSVKRGSGTDSLASRDELSIRVISE